MGRWQINTKTQERRWVEDSARPPGDPAFPYAGQKAANEVKTQEANISNDAARLQLERERFELARQQAAVQAQGTQQTNAAKELELDQARREAEGRNAYNPQQLDRVRDDSWNKLQTLHRIRKNYNEATLPAIGFGAETAAEIGGTNAANIKTALAELKAGGALAEVMRMTQATGKNPFTPMSNSDVELVSRAITGVEQSQSPEDFFQAITPYRNAYTNAYAGSVGAQALNRGVDNSIERWKRNNPRRTPEQEQEYVSTIKTQARENYERRMRAKPRADAPRKEPAGKFLGWEK